MATKLFDSHDVSEQIDVLRRAVRELIRVNGPIPPLMAEDHDWDFEVREADRLAKEAEISAAQAEQAKQVLAKALQHAKEISKPPAQKAAEQAAQRAQADLEAHQKVADDAAARAKEAQDAAIKVSPHSKAAARAAEDDDTQTKTRSRR